MQAVPKARAATVAGALRSGLELQRPNLFTGGCSQKRSSDCTSHTGCCTAQDRRQVKTVLLSSACTQQDLALCLPLSSRPRNQTPLQQLRGERGRCRRVVSRCSR